MLFVNKPYQIKTHREGNFFYKEYDLHNLDAIESKYARQSFFKEKSMLNVVLPKISWIYDDSKILQISRKNNGDHHV